MRKPLTGALMVNVLQAKDLDRPAVATKFGRPKTKAESTVVIKIEDTPRARTHPSRSDRWNEEFELHVDKANEVEVTIYDKQSANDSPIPIGLLWIRLSDVVEELRRKKAGQDVAGNAAWVTANKVKGGHGHSHSGSLSHVPPFNQPSAPVGQQMAEAYPGSAQPLPGPQQVDGITAWFAVEPEGQIQLHLNFGEHLACSCFFCQTEHDEYSQEQRAEEADGSRWSSWASRCCAQEKGRSARAERSQICAEAVLHRHPLRLLPRLPAQRGRHEVRRLQLCLSQKVFQQRCHQVYIQIQCRDCECLTSIQGSDTTDWIVLASAARFG